LGIRSSFIGIYFVPVALVIATHGIIKKSDKPEKSEILKAKAIKDKYFESAIGAGIVQKTSDSERNVKSASIAKG
jgi:hypothetical protein